MATAATEADTLKQAIKQYALDQGVGTIAGCFYLLEACPVGREADGGMPPEEAADEV